MKHLKSFLNVVATPSTLQIDAGKLSDPQSEQADVGCQDGNQKGYLSKWRLEGKIDGYFILCIYL